MENDETILKLYENFADEIYEMTVKKLDISKEIWEEEDLIIRTL